MIMASSNRVEELKQRFIALDGVYDESWEALAKLQPDYFEAYLNMQDVSQRRKRLSPKIQQFIYLSVAACCTHIHSPAVKAHTSAAIKLGATKEELFEVIGLTSLVGIHAVTQGVPLLLELCEEFGLPGAAEGPGVAEERERIKQDFIKKRGFWTDTWNPLLQMDAPFFESYTKFSTQSYVGPLEPKDREIIVCAFDAATTHLYNRGTKIHMRNAIKLGATPEELMEMLEITSLMGMHGVTNAAKILADQLG